jgi:hypothetical protein
MLAMTDSKAPATGRAKGAIALAEKLTPEERKLRAAKGAAARWKKALAATHKGNFQNELGIDVECYVLNDPTKTAVISQTGMARALGLSKRGNVLERFISSQAMAPYVVAETAQKLKNPIAFQWDSGVAGIPPAAVKGYDAALLIDLCNSIAVANAAGALKGKRYEDIIRQAAIVTGAAAKSGIRSLVYAMAGYSPSTQEVIDAFKHYVREEAKKYEQEFPNEIYMQWHRLYEIQVPMRGKSWHLRHLTVRHIYYPLAQSNGKVLELLRALKAQDGNRKTKLFQFLNDVGARALRMHIGRVLEMAESSKTKAEYDAKIVARFGGQQELELLMPSEQQADHA